jgi:putative ABC transport system permease protein
VPLIAGRAFSRDRVDAVQQQPGAPAQSRGIVLDRDAASALGWPDPADAVGESVHFAYVGQRQQPLEIVGVVETVPLALRERGSRGIVYGLTPSPTMPYIVRLATTTSRLGRAHRQVFRTCPRSPAAHRCFDQTFESAYWTFGMINSVFALLSMVAIAIAAFGLLGMASYMTARRTREIGLRKSQGARSTQILRLLLLEFSKPVVIANALAWPIAFVAADRYLDLFAVRVTLTPVPFVVALLATLAVAWIAVGGRVVRAAWTRPAAALRDE